MTRATPPELREALAERLRAWSEVDPDPDYFFGGSSDVFSAMQADCYAASQALSAAAPCLDTIQRAREAVAQCFEERGCVRAFAAGIRAGSHDHLGDVQSVLRFAAIDRATLEARIKQVEAERDEARDTNRELHRRLQSVEGPLLARAEKAERAAQFWLARRRDAGARTSIFRQKNDAATARADALERAVTGLGEENERLKAALKRIAEQPRRFDRGGVSYGIGYALDLAKVTARAALATQEAGDVE